MYLLSLSKLAWREALLFYIPYLKCDLELFLLIDLFYWHDFAFRGLACDSPSLIWTCTEGHRAQNTDLRMMLILLSEESGAVRGRQKLPSNYMVWFQNKAILGTISKGREEREEGDRDVSLKTFSPFLRHFPEEVIVKQSLETQEWSLHTVMYS